jgi:hypothetical protein
MASLQRAGTLKAMAPVPSTAQPLPRRQRQNHLKSAMIELIVGAARADVTKDRYCPTSFGHGLECIGLLKLTKGQRIQK